MHWFHNTEFQFSLYLLITYNTLISNIHRYIYIYIKVTNLVVR